MIINNTPQEMKETNHPLEDNLYNRLDDKVARDLDALGSKYPVIYRSIKQALKKENNYFSNTLSFETCYYMNVYLKVDLNNFSRIFKHS